MKRYLHHPLALAACAALLAFGTISCQDHRLNPVPETTVSDQAVFTTPSRITAQVNNLYGYVKTGGFLGGRIQIFSDIRASDFINRTSNGVTGLSVWNHTLTEASQNDVINTWGFGYAAINQANVFLDGLDANADKLVAPAFPANYATVTANNYRGEARLLRALSYYYLLQLYARPYADGGGSKPGLPLRLKGETNDMNNNLVRSTVAQVYDQILLDLNFAELNLPLSYTGSTAATLNTTRAQRNTAIALKTRVYLSMGRYADVIAEANKLVPAVAPFVAPTGVAHSLNASIAALFAPPQETAETILAFPFTAQDAPGTQNQLAYYYLPASQGGNGEYGLNTSAGGILTDPGFAATDARRTALITTSGTESFLKKYPTGTPYTDKAPVIRYAEVLLNLAEARFQTQGAGDTQALALLNAVYQRSNPTAVTTPPTPVKAYAAFTDPTTAINAVLLERRIEFLGEGLRNFDIMRLNATIPGKGSVPAIPNTSTNYVWPIPSTELAVNTLMTRN